MDFGGQEVRFIVEEGAGNLSERSIYVEEDTGDVVDSAVFNRNLIVEEIALPDDRPGHIHAWTRLNSKKLRLCHLI